MKNIMRLFVVLLVMLSFIGCQRVEPNYVGVQMENYGKEGKNDFKLVKGKVSTWMPGSQLYQAPLWEQRGTFDRPFSLKASNNTEFTIAPKYSFKIIESRGIDVVFNNKHLEGDFMTSLQNNVLEPRIYDILKEESRKFSTDELMADGGSLKFEEVTQAIVAKEFEKQGLELISFSATPDFSDKVKAKIDNRNEVNQNIAVIDQQIEEQRKRNELEELKTKQNLLRSQGITPQLLQEQFIEKWDGKTPLYGNLPITLMKKE